MDIVRGTKTALTNEHFEVQRAPARVAIEGLGAGETVTVRTVVQGRYGEFANNTVTGADDTIVLNGPGLYSLTVPVTVADLYVTVTNQDQAGGV